MNKLLLASLVCFTCVPAFVAAQSTSDSAQPPVNVVVTSEARELALGYAAAFAQIKGTPVHLILQKEGKPYTLTDVKSVKAKGGVLRGLGGNDHIHGRGRRLRRGLGRDKRGHAGETNKTGEE
jgi:hypothetical protein